MAEKFGYVQDAENRTMAALWSDVIAVTIGIIGFVLIFIKNRQMKIGSVLDAGKLSVLLYCFNKEVESIRYQYNDIQNQIRPNF